MLLLGPGISTHCINLIPESSLWSCELFYLICGLGPNTECDLESQNTLVLMAYPRGLQMAWGGIGTRIKELQSTGKQQKPCRFWPCPLTSDYSVVVFFQFSKPLLIRKAVQIQEWNPAVGMKRLQGTALLKPTRTGKLGLPHLFCPSSSLSLPSSLLLSPSLSPFFSF